MTQYLWTFRCAALEGFESTHRQNKYATLTGVQDVFQICEISPYELHRCVGKKRIDILPFSGQAYDPVPEDDGIYSGAHQRH